MNKNIKEYLFQWIHKAEEDLLVINNLTKNEITANSAVCFHCQQLAEKYLKVYLIAHKKEIKRTHNIEYLLNECGKIENEFSLINPGNLSDFGVDIRYPGDVYIPSDKETLEHKKIAVEIRDMVRQKLKDIINPE